MLYQPPPAFPRGTLPDWGSHERRQTMPVPSFAAATDIVPVPDHSVMQHAALEGLLQGTSSQRLTAASALDLSRPAQDASPPYFSHDLAPLRDVAQGAELRYPTPDSPEGDAQADDGGSMATETAGTKDFDSSRAAVLQPPQPAEPPGSPAAAPGQEWISRPPAATPHLPPMVQPSLVHDIALHAHALFTSPRGTPQRIDLSRRLAVLLHRVTPQHLRPSAMVAPIEYYPIFESDMFTICAFALRAGASMPIHDHPEMNVFSKVVYGTLHVKSYRVLSHPAPQALSPDTHALPALITLDADIPHTHPASLQEIDAGTPGASGLHSFRAVSDGVLVLDVIGPPYAGDRPCRYYREASEDEITNLALPEIAGSAKLGSRRAGSSDEEVWGERSSKAARLGAAAAASRKSRRAGTSGKRRSKETRERIVKPEVVPTTMDGWIAYMQSQAQGMSGPAPHRPSDPTVGSLGLPPGAVVFTPETSRIDIETSTGSLASLEGQLESWALGMELDPRIDSGVNLDLSTRSLPDARLALGGGSGNIPSGRSQFGPTVTRRPLGGTMGMRANSRQMSRGFSTGGVGPTFWSMEQGNVGTCVWLVEDPAVEYECVEREYVGEAVYLGADAESEGAQSVVEPAEVPVVVVNL